MVETVVLGDRVWINTDDHGVRCAIYVERSNEARSISAGDSVWWQGRTAYWTPRNRAFTDYALARIGYSGVSRPTSAPATDGAFDWTLGCAHGRPVEVHCPDCERIHREYRP